MYSVPRNHPPGASANGGGSAVKRFIAVWVAGIREMRVTEYNILDREFLRVAERVHYGYIDVGT